MANKIPKPAYKILLVFIMLAFTVVACYSKKDGDKKDPVTDTTAVKPMDQPTTPPDTATKMDAPADTAKKKPVKDPS